MDKVMVRVFMFSVAHFQSLYKRHQCRDGDLKNFKAAHMEQTYVCENTEQLLSHFYGKFTYCVHIYSTSNYILIGLTFCNAQLQNKKKEKNIYFK